MAGSSKIIAALCLLGVTACDTTAESAARDAATSEPDAAQGERAAAVPGGGLSAGALDGTLEVHVVDTLGRAVPQATVRVDAREVSADDTGYARVDNVRGTVGVHVSADGFVPAAWLGVAAAQVTIVVRPTVAVEAKGARVKLRVEGLAALAAREDGATYVLRMRASLPLDLEGFDAESLLDPPAASVCRFGAAELDACTLEVASRIGRQRIYGVVEAVDASGVLVEPVALTVSDELDLAAGSSELAAPLSLLAAADLIRASVAPVSPPLLVDGAKVVGVPGMKLSEGVMIFPATEQALLPRSGGALGEGTYWYISQASYVDADGDALRLRVARRGLADSELAPDPWPKVVARPSLEGTRLTLAPSEAELRRVLVRDEHGEPALDALLIGEVAELELSAQTPVGSVIVEDIHAFFDPVAFALGDVLADTLWQVQRTSRF